MGMIDRKSGVILYRDPDSETAGVPAYCNTPRDEDTLARPSADQRDVHDHVDGPYWHLDRRAVDRTRIWIQSDCDRYCLQRGRGHCRSIEPNCGSALKMATG